MKTDRYNEHKSGDIYDPGKFAMDVHADIQTIKACLKFILNSYERAEGHPGALIVNSLIAKLEEGESNEQ